MIYNTLLLSLDSHGTVGKKYPTRIKNYPTISNKSMLNFLLQHISIFALVKLDRALVAISPENNYRAKVKPWMARTTALAAWTVCLLSSLAVNKVYDAFYEPAALLCVPNLPKGFFLAVIV